MGRPFVTQFREDYHVDLRYSSELVDHAIQGQTHERLDRPNGGVYDRWCKPKSKTRDKEVLFSFYRIRGSFRVEE